MGAQDEIPVYLSLGSNLGDRTDNLRRALRLLAPGARVTAVSSVYETAPVGPQAQPSFLNLVASASTLLTPADLLGLVKDVESSLGRTPSYYWGPRIVDIDILLYSDQAVILPDLEIPHKEMLNRAFVLVPLCEIAPGVSLPGGSCACDYMTRPPARDQTIRRLGPLGPALESG